MTAVMSKVGQSVSVDDVSLSCHVVPGRNVRDGFGLDWRADWRIGIGAERMNGSEQNFVTEVPLLSLPTTTKQIQIFKPYIVKLSCDANRKSNPDPTPDPNETLNPKLYAQNPNPRL
jgi:hypothetical protein